MKVKAIKDFSSTTYGNVSADDVLDMPDALANHHIKEGRVSPYESTYNTKVIREVPTVAGGDKESSSSPAAPASQKKTAKPSKKRKPLLSIRQSD